MTEIRSGQLVITIDDGSPEDRLCWIRQALAAALRNYAINPDKRFRDHEHAIVLAELMEEVID